MEKNVDILRGEFIGKQVKALNKGTEGKIIDESKNSFLIRTKNNMKKRLLKQNALFELKLKSGNALIDGNSILMKPEDRIKIRKPAQRVPKI
ncbi:hypothetical protein CMO93_03700 [Candidatus Woesearchaeota archaeon]|jgi:RNase P/RNase MRP subunit p29|nr:hypothetical protein [Candidatus Woesearchaeota archaeon]|tara:strand:+ start:517 stop:792 length:276 start_codon:yes stop_codon:yes gene_type:complete